MYQEYKNENCIADIQKITDRHSIEFVEKKQIKSWRKRERERERKL